MLLMLLMPRTPLSLLMEQLEERLQSIRTAPTKTTIRIRSSCEQLEEPVLDLIAIVAVLSMKSFTFAAVSGVTSAWRNKLTRLPAKCGLF